MPQNLEEAEDPTRWISARWSESINNSFRTVVEIKSYDRTGLVADLSGQLGNMHINIHNMSSKSTGNGLAFITFDITVRNKSHLRDIISRLSSVKGVLSVERSNR